MVGPNKQFDPGQALDKALQLFWKQGYEATSMQDLVEAMGVNRASMYQTYGNKYELYLASLNRYVDTTLATFKQVLDKPGPILENLHRLFQQAIVQSLEGDFQGCFINNTAVELGAHDPELAQKIRDVWIQFENVFTIQLQCAIDAGELQAGSDARKIAQLLNTNLQGLIIQTKINPPKKKIFTSIDALFECIQR